MSIYEQITGKKTANNSIYQQITGKPISKSNNNSSINTNTNTKSSLIGKNSITNLDNLKKIVDTSAFNDGYNFGDITKTILATKNNLKTARNATIADAGTSILKGISDIGANSAKTAAALVAQVAKATGNNEYAEKIKNRIAGNDENTNKKIENNTLSGILSKANNKFKNNSLLGNTFDEINQGIGYYAGMQTLQNVGVPWQVTAGVTTAGNELADAYKNNASDLEAWASAAISAGAEIGSEYIFGGIKLPGTGKATEQLIGKLTDKISKNGIKYLIQAGLNMAGEGLEENISGLFSALGKKLTYMNDKELKELYSKEDALKDFVIGSAVAGLTMAGSPSTYNNVKTGRSLITGLTNEQANQIEIETEKAIEEIESDGKNLTNKEKAAIEEQITNEVINNNSISNISNNTNQNNIEQYVKKEYNILNNNNNNNNIVENNNSNELNLQNNQTNNNLVNEYEKSNINNNQISVLQEQIEELNNRIEQLDNENNNIQNLTPTEQAEYNKLKTIDNTFGLNNEEQIRYDYLQNKLNNNPNLKTKITFDDIKPEYNKYKDLSDFNNKILKEAETFIPGYRNTEKRTKNEWLQIAEYIGNNLNSNSNEETIKYAIQSWFEAHPNTKETLNRQGKKYVKFTIDEWVNAVLDNSNNIKLAKGNIPINNELFNKYSNATETMQSEINNYDGKVEIKDVPELNNYDLDNMNKNQLSNLAIEIFEKYNSSNVFNNNGNKIEVSHTGIKESIEKILYNSNQKKLLLEHLKVFSDLGDIIESATLAGQTSDTKINTQDSHSDNVIWNYYLNGLKINNKKYLFEFDVVSIKNGQNNYRVQRLQEIKTGNSVENNVNNTVTPTLESPVSTDNNTTNQTKSQNALLSNINYAEKQNNNTNNPLTIAALKKQNAKTTPILSKTTVETGKGESKFAKNIENKTNMLTDESKKTILSSEEVNYYKEVSNEESLLKAKERLDKGGEAETLRWLSQDTSKSTSVDVAEGWILLKQYQDEIKQTTDTLEKDRLNRSMVEVAKHMREIGTKAGQTVQAYNILNRLTPDGMVYYAQSELSEAFDKMSKNKTKEWIDDNRSKFELTPEETQFIMDTMEKVQNMEDGYDKRVELAKIQKILTDKLPPAKGTAIKAWMRISMLFNPKTQVRNIAGNALIVPINTFSDLFASATDKIISKKTGVRTTGNLNLKNYLKGSKRGIYEATNDYKLGINTKDMSGNRFELNEGKAFKEKTIIGKTLNKTNDLLSYVMDVGDRLFSEAAFENSLQNQLILNNTTEVTQDMIDIATQEALSRTWNDNNSYTKFVINARNGVNKFLGIEGYGLGDVLLPFAKTPANLTKAIVDYSPAGLVKTITEGRNLKRALSNGQYTAQMQHQFVQDLGKATAGTMLYVLGVALAVAKITSGKSDDDKDVANFLKNTLGISNYSIKIGDKTFTYDWAQPLAAPLSITANIVSSRKNKGQALLEGIVSSLDSAGSILLEQSFLQSINEVITDNSGPVSGLINSILDLPTRAIPTLSKQITDMVDGTQRVSYEYNQPLQTAINKAKAKIPGLSKTLAPSVDTMGREIQKYGGKNNIFNVFLNPANVNTENISESAAEIYRLYQETGDKTIMPRVAPYYLNKKGEKIVLTSELKSEYQKLSGKMIEENVQKLLNNKQYRNMSNEDKADIVNNIVNYSYNVAQKDILGTEISSTYLKAYTYDKIGNINDYYILKSQDFTSDKDKNGKTISGSKKQKVVNYVNSMNLSATEKAILLKMNNYSVSDYDNQIINYVNNQKLSIADKTEVLETLGYTVKDGRVYS